MAREWKRNIWTGNSTLKVGDTRRIVRLEGGGLYYAEEWGDYSAAYPVKGPIRTTLQAALKDNPS